MKRIIPLILLLFIPLALPAQNNQFVGNITNNGTDCSTTNACVQAQPLPAGTASVAVGVSGTWTGTLSFEVSVDGSQANKRAVSCIPTDGTTPATSTTSNENWHCDASGMKLFQVRGSATMTGTAAIVISPSGAISASTLGGNGAAGTTSGQANNVIPLASGATAITKQSHLDDGATTAGTITSSEPLSVTALNTTIYATGSATTAIATAVAAIPSGGARIILPSGTLTPTAQSALPNPTCFIGQGQDITIIKPTSALLSTLFNVTGAGYGWCFENMTIDMSNVTSGAQDAIDFNPTTGILQQPIMLDVKIIYPASSTGKAVYLTNTGLAHIEGIHVQGGGAGIYIQGDGTAENTFINDTLDSQNGPCFEIIRTTATDVGGYYGTNLRCTNTLSIATDTGGVLSGESGQNSAGIFRCEQCTFDGILGGPSLSVSNWYYISMDDPWLTNSALLASNFAALKLNNVNNGYFNGGNFTSLWSDLQLTGTDSAITFSNQSFGGIVTNVTAVGSTLSNLRLLPKFYGAATPISTADAELIIAAAPTTAIPATYGQTVAVDGGAGLGQTLQLYDVRDNTCGGMRINGGQTFQILNCSGGLAFQINAFTSGGTITGPAESGTLVLQAPANSVATNYGTAIGATNIIASANADIYNVILYVYTSVIGTSCSASTNNVILSVNWTDPASVTHSVALTTLSFSGVGTAGALEQGSVPIVAKAASAITYSTTSTLASTGCSPAPKYIAWAKAIN